MEPVLTGIVALTHRKKKNTVATSCLNLTVLLITLEISWWLEFER